MKDRIHSIDTCRQHRTGYTLVEILVVIAILGLATAMVVPHLIKPGSLQVQAAVRLVMSDILIAQNDAVAKQAVRRMIFEPTNNRYRLADQNDATIGAPWKGGGASGQNYIVDLSNDNRFNNVVMENVNFGGTNVLEFDELGSPITGGSVDIVFENLRYRITVAPFTGRVTVEPV